MPLYCIESNTARFQDIKHRSVPFVSTRSMDMKEKDLVDVSSSYMLFEATGDSEVDCSMGEEVASEIGSAEDDAQSCSYDNSETRSAAEFSGYESLNDDHNDEDEKKVIVYGTSYCEEDEIMQGHQKSFVSDDSGQELLDEMEKNRLFWEACLAS